MTITTSRTLTLTGNHTVFGGRQSRRFSIVQSGNNSSLNARSSCWCPFPLSVWMMMIIIIWSVLKDGHRHCWMRMRLCVLSQCHTDWTLWWWDCLILLSQSMLAHSDWRNCRLSKAWHFALDTVTATANVHHVRQWGVKRALCFKTVAKIV